VKLKALALACALLAGNATASVVIDFEGVGNGAAVNDYYNGGTDSLGNSGTNYGVHFSGGTVAYNQFGAYIAGPTFMTFSAASAGAGISVLARGYSDDSMSYTYIDNTMFEPVMIVDYDEPCCRINRTVFPAGTLWPFIVYTDFRVNGIQFNTRELDNLIFASTVLQTTRRPTDPTGTVPEPGSIALLGLGALGLLGARQRKSAKSQNA
jgi:hypothetical protein